MADEVGGEHDVGLLDHLVAVELERVEVQQQRVLLARRALEVPALALEEALVLEHDPERLVARHVHALGGAAPALDLVGGERQLAGERGVRDAGPRRRATR